MHRLSLGSSTLLLAFLCTSPALAQTVAIDFSDWDRVCDYDGRGGCAEAYVDIFDPPTRDDVRQTMCGLSHCLDLNWSEDGAIRRIKTPWAPSGDQLTAYVRVRMLLTENYLEGETFVGPHYQPLARLHGDEWGEFGVDLALLHRNVDDPYFVIVSDPAGDARHGVEFVDALQLGCSIPASRLRAWHTISARVTLDPDGGGNDYCRLSVDDEFSEASGLDFRDGSTSPTAHFNAASFFGRVSNSTSISSCSQGWPPCQSSDESRTIRADSLCVTNDPEAPMNGVCGTEEPAEDAGSPPLDGGSGRPTGEVGFRGSGGCVCEASGAGGRGTGGPAFAVLSALLFAGRRFRRHQQRCSRWFTGC